MKFCWIFKLKGDLENLKYITLAMDYLDEDFDQNPYIYNENSLIKKLLDWEIEKYILCKHGIFSINFICTLLS